MFKEVYHCCDHLNRAHWERLYSFGRGQREEEADPPVPRSTLRWKKI